MIEAHELIAGRKQMQSNSPKPNDVSITILIKLSFTNILIPQKIAMSELEIVNILCNLIVKYSRSEIFYFC